MRILYRAGQFWRALWAHPSQHELQEARAILTPELMAVFQSQQPSEQAHSLEILHKLQDAGHRHPDLMVAALLHDAGKSRCPLNVWERALVVLGKFFFPNRVPSWGGGEPAAWRRSFVVAEQHARWGAEMAALAGASSLATALIRRHQTPLKTAPTNLEDRLLLQLQQVDNES